MNGSLSIEGTRLLAFLGCATVAAHGGKRGQSGHSFADLGLAWFPFSIVGSVVAIALSQLFRSSAAGVCGTVGGPACTAFILTGIV